MREVYLDHAATTLTRPEVLQVMHPIFTDHYGNPSSVHRFGRAVRGKLDNARTQIANFLGSSAREIVFTSGGTEADNAAIQSGISNCSGPKHLITSAMEHHAVLHMCQYLEQTGVRITYLMPNAEGHITVEHVMDAIDEDTCMISLMYVNNETGAIQPIAEIGEAIRSQSNRILMHTDAVQAAGILDLSVQELGVDYLSISGHKIHGPKGIGALYVKQGTPYVSLLHGGLQESGRRAGTENVPGIVGMGVAAELAAKERGDKIQHLAHVKSKMIHMLQAGIDEMIINSPENSVPSILNVTFPGVTAERLLIKLDMLGIAAASGSACTSGSMQPSHVLLAMNYPEDRVRSSVRFSFSSYTTMEEIEYAVEIIIRVVRSLRAS